MVYKPTTISGGPHLVGSFFRFKRGHDASLPPDPMICGIPEVLVLWMLLLAAQKDALGSSSARWGDHGRSEHSKGKKFGETRNNRDFNGISMG